MRSAFLVGLLALCAGCTVKLQDPSGRACDDAHPCAEGRVCSSGTCQAKPSSNGGDAGTDAGAPCDAAVIGTACTAGKGVCEAQGQWVCDSGVQRCSATAGSPGTELCDGLDNDCDGDTDEATDLTAPACALTKGVCAGAPPRVCNGTTGWSDCDYGPQYQGAESSCDGLDNDCDGTIDDVSGCLYTLAGAGPPGFADGVGTEARFARPWYLRLGPDNQLYVADADNHALRKIDPGSGTVTTIVGTTGRCGFKDGPLAQAELCDPVAVAFDAAGALYFTEYSGGRLRKIVNGNVITVAGTGSWGFANGDALTQAEFRGLMGLAVLPNGDVLLADSANHRIRRFIAATSRVVTEAGTGTNGDTDGTRLSMQLSEPVDLAVDSAGTLYVSETSGDRIRKLPAGGTSVILAGSAVGTDGYVEGVGTAARFRDPTQLLLDEAAGLLYVADGSSYRVRAVPLDGVTSTYPVVGGSDWGYLNGSSANAAFKYLTGVARLGSTWYVSDEGNHAVRKLLDAGSFAASTVEDFCGVPPLKVTDGPAHQALLNQPDGVLLMPDGRILWTEDDTMLLRELSADGQTVTTLVGDVNDPAGKYVNGTLAQARLDDPHDVVLGPDGALYIAEGGLSGIRKVDLAAGMVSTFAGPQTSESNGHVNGTLTQARFRHPIALAFGKDAVGGDVLYVAEEGSAIVRKIGFPNGPVSDFAGTVSVRGFAEGGFGAGTFDGPTALAADGDGNVYVGDSRMLRKVTSDGVITNLVTDVGFDISDIAVEGNALLLVGWNIIARYDLGTGNLTTELSLNAGWRDGLGDQRQGYDVQCIVPTPEAYYFMDLPGARLRRLWR